MYRYAGFDPHRIEVIFPISRFDQAPLRYLTLQPMVEHLSEDDRPTYAPDATSNDLVRFPVNILFYKTNFFEDNDRLYISFYAKNEEDPEYEFISWAKLTKKEICNWSHNIDICAHIERRYSRIHLRVLNDNEAVEGII